MAVAIDADTLDIPPIDKVPLALTSPTISN